jgi:hypothetical protein
MRGDVEGRGPFGMIMKLNFGFRVRLGLYGFGLGLGGVHVAEQVGEVTGVTVGLDGGCDSPALVVDEFPAAGAFLLNRYLPM